jgi:hypothetical protein
LLLLLNCGPIFNGTGARMPHMKVNAVVPLPSSLADKEIFQSILAVCCGERFFADLAMHKVTRKFWLGAYANELVSRLASRAHEVNGFGHNDRGTVYLNTQ